jgi:hypothetical protein
MATWSFSYDSDYYNLSSSEQTKLAEHLDAAVWH